MEIPTFGDYEQGSQNVLLDELMSRRGTPRRHHDVTASYSEWSSRVGVTQLAQVTGTSRH